MNDSVWLAICESPVVKEELSDEQRAALEDGLADICAGRIVTRDHILTTIEEMRIAQGD
jgi:predicted transcriptional regulator